MSGDLIRVYGSYEEQRWALLARYHHERKERVAANLASDVADALRFYRLHKEALDEIAPGFSAPGRA